MISASSSMPAFRLGGRGESRDDERTSRVTLIGGDGGDSIPESPFSESICTSPSDKSDSCPSWSSSFVVLLLRRRLGGDVGGCGSCASESSLSLSKAMEWSIALRGEDDILPFAYCNVEADSDAG